MTIVSNWLEMTKDYKHYTPDTRNNVKFQLRKWEAFLLERHGRTDRPSIEDFEAYESLLIGQGKKVASVVVILSYITMYYTQLANRHKNSKWVSFEQQLKAHKPGKDRGTSTPHQPFPLKLLPDILDASRDPLLEKYEAYPLVALFLYTGIRAQGIGIQVDSNDKSRLDFENGIIYTRVKVGYPVELPMHDCLREILREHLEDRTYESEQVFSRGSWPYQYITNSGHGEVDQRAMKRNREHVWRILRRVEKVLAERGIDIHLTSHRFRESVGTYASQYRYFYDPPIDDKDIRLLLSHGAKTITQHYDQRDVLAVKSKWTQADWGSHESLEMMISGKHPREAPANPQGLGTVDEAKMAKIERLLSLPADKLDALLKLMEA